MKANTQTKTNLFLADHTGHDIRAYSRVQVFGEWIELGDGGYNYCRDCETIVA